MVHDFRPALGICPGSAKLYCGNVSCASLVRLLAMQSREPFLYLDALLGGVSINIAIRQP
jgi:hypothetical protein